MNTNISQINSAASYVIKIAAGVVFLFLCTQIQIPLKPVPITLQTAGVLVIALCYGKYESVASVLLYITAGVLGAPVFANFNSGIIAISGPTGGYIVGFVLCAIIVGILKEKFGEDKMWKLFLYSIIGSVSIFMVGISHLAGIIGFEKAIQFGFLPFIIPGIFKAIFAAVSVRIIKSKF